MSLLKVLSTKQYILGVFEARQAKLIIKMLGCYTKKFKECDDRGQNKILSI